MVKSRHFLMWHKRSNQCFAFHSAHCNVTMSQETLKGHFKLVCVNVLQYCLLCGGVSIRYVDSLLLYPATVQQTNMESQVGDHVQIDVFVFVSNSKKYLSYIAKCFCPKLQNVPLAPSPCSVNKHWVSWWSPLFGQKNILASHLDDHSAVLDFSHSILIVKQINMVFQQGLG